MYTFLENKILAPQLSQLFFKNSNENKAAFEREVAVFVCLFVKLKAVYVHL